MTGLVLGLIVFLGIHSLPMAPAWRDRVRGRLGPRAYRGLYTLIALAGLALVVWGKSRAGFVPLWDPPPWGRSVAHVLMPLALVLVVASNLRGRLRRRLRHPLLLGTGLWAVAHLLANGDLASLLLFGGFGLWALADGISAQRRQVAVPPAGPGWHDPAAVVLGLLGYALIGHFHAALFGPPVF